ncbi:TRAP transporter substrate-binding protein DctP [Pseudoprimorskyibacter insulae]|uniref:C4-dicarboxylate-binding periplasmic protein DctP n=1 Tax=Pseudoprimorskyibacter insulae TaxID=1695997 RepID=A0A2R8API5_9RHOB|nr:TRAP transporter substrate-binding protein DctP [Pseudoprimorskyibacter insulae]SPF77943.1 C4-dicarboxylate-binding periplasmic protein DctP [Pseudoprimorskyibacter insulae]
MKLFTRAAAIGAVVGSLLAAAPAFAADKLVITMDTPPSHLRTRMINEFANRLGERSNGSLTFQIFDSNQLFSSRDAMKAVARGDAGMAILVTPYLSRVVADYNVFDLPMLNGMSDEARAAMLDNGLGDALSTQFENKMGVVVPGKYWSMGKVFLFSTEKPMKSFADLKNMQIRIPGGAALVMRLDAIGASAVSMPGSDVPLALQQGVVDATMGGPDYIYGNKMWDAGVQHGFWDGGIIGFLTPMVNKGYWDSLTEDEQALFRSTWDEITMEQRQKVLEEEASNIAKLAEHGIVTENATAEDIAQANEAMLAIQDAMIEKLEISAEIVQLAADAAK